MDSQTLRPGGATAETVPHPVLAWLATPARASAAGMKDWLQQRRALVDELAAELRTGFQAVAAFRAGEYLDSVERQETLAQRIVEHDHRIPEAGSGARRLAAASELRGMNAELRRLADIQAALIELGGRSVRCFQRVWALGAASYELDSDDRRPPAAAVPARPEAKEK
ncbi:MAG: hypothetical protein ACRD1C_02455 [Terriglobales bacterium]